MKIRQAKKILNHDSRYKKSTVEKAVKRSHGPLEVIEKYGWHYVKKGNKFFMVG